MEEKNWCEETLKIVESQIGDINNSGIVSSNIDYLYKLVDIHKDLSNEKYWKDKLIKYFADFYIDDLTDLNYSTCLTYLLTLSEINASLFSREVDILLESRNLYFMEILLQDEA